MSDQLLAPRITAASLNNYVNRTVTIVGQVTQLLGEEAIIDADGNVTVRLTREAHLTNGNSAVFVGKVQPDLSVKVLNVRDVGPNVNMQLANAVAELVQKFPAIHGN